MANFKKFLWTLAALPLLVSCSDDKLASDNAGVNEFLKGEGDGVYMSVQFRPASDSGSRSYTSDVNMSDHGTETGTDVENNINRVLIVLTNEDNVYFSHAYVESGNMDVSMNKTIYEAKAKFSKDDIAGIYAGVAAGNGANVPVHVFIYANPNKQLEDMASALAAWDGEGPWDGDTGVPNWLDLTCKISDTNTLWNKTNKGSFLMTNVSMATRYFPPSIDNWNLYTTESNPFDLSGMNNQNTSNEVDNQKAGGSINIHRMAVRFDFRDGSQKKKTDVLYEGQDWNGNGIEGKPFTYAVMTKSVTENGEPKLEDIVNAKIVNMSLVNVLNSEYYLGRVSPLGNASDATLLGAEKPWFTSAGGSINKEKPGNYVVSPYVSEKRNSLIKEDPSKYLLYPFFDNNGEPKTAALGNNAGWLTTPVADVTGASAKTDLYPQDATTFYNTWCYLTENTLPGNSDNTSPAQVNGSSTGIVFRAKLLAGSHLEHTTDYWEQQLAEALKETGDSKPILYLYSGNLYCGWDNVVAAAMAAAGWEAPKVEGTEANNQDLDRSAPLFKKVFGDRGTGKITFTASNGKTYTYAEYTKDDEGKYTTTLEPVDETSLNYLYTQWGGGSTSGDAWVAFQSAVVGQTFALYEKYNDNNAGGFGWGYYCYYYYWNRHNDNYNNGVMAPMEFATVRNNVYKIAVTRLNSLGHPRIPANDPDKPTPDTPDERGDIYLTVSVQVLPWVVRFNNVEF